MSVEGCPLSLGEGHCGMQVLLEDVARDASYQPEDVRGCNVEVCSLPSITQATMRATTVIQERAQGDDLDPTESARYSQLLNPTPKLGDFEV